MPRDYKPSDTLNWKGPRIRDVFLVFAGFAAAAAAVMYVTKHPPPPQSPAERPLEVKELIEAVSEQLAAVDVSRREKGLLPLFKLRDFEMEINFVVRNSGGAKAEVVGIGTNLDAATERVQKLHLRWDAITTQNSKVAQSIDASAIDSLIGGKKADPPTRPRHGTKPANKGYR